MLSLAPLWSFVKKTCLYVFAVPVLMIVLGGASNQAVLIANHDTFPVLLNSKKLEEYRKPHPPAVDLLSALMGVKPPIGPQPLTPQVAAPWIFSDDYVHIEMTDKSHLKALADIFDFKEDGVESIGDLTADLGVWFQGYVTWIWGVVLALRALLTKES